MVASAATGIRLDELAQGLFDAFTRFRLKGPRSRRRAGDLKEVEFLTLTLLSQSDTLIVGEIQRQLGVLPAQMSRIIRSLEDRDRPLIACRINPNDKRKIDVALTPAGRVAYQDYQTGRVRGIVSLLAKLPEEDLEDLGRVLEKIHDLLGPPPSRDAS
jgi:DNA-binding MarR family transcriptional regulator